MTVPRPLCSAGRCDALLRAFAAQRAADRDRDAGRLVDALVAVLRDHGLDPDDQQVRATVARHLTATTTGTLT